MNGLYQASLDYLHQAKATIPLGSQTFSKSYMSIPMGGGPLFVEKGLGGYFWDVDGRKYIDLVSGLLSVLLGYQDKEVDKAVAAQMKKGVTFSLPHRVEAEVAEQIVDMVPCAEQVRFGKNGSDVTAGAVRLARAFTGRDFVAVCGYHGWQDWYIGSTTRNLGVPEATRALTLPFKYNDLKSLEDLFEQYPEKIAAVILEPMNLEYPRDNFLQKVKAICQKNQAVLIFDEMITGFRLSNGGAQELFGVTPDLVTLGKGVANGYPLSVLAGRKDIMCLAEEIFFSFTFGGETLSLCAARAVMDKLQSEPVIETICQNGQELMQAVNIMLQELNLSGSIQLNGHPSWSIFSFQDHGQYTLWELKTFIIQSLCENGVFMLGSHNVNYAHTRDDIQKILAVYLKTFQQLKYHIDRGSLHDQLYSQVLSPLFSVR